MPGVIAFDPIDIKGLLATSLANVIDDFVSFIDEHTYSIMELVFGLNADKTINTTLVHGLFDPTEITSLLQPGVSAVSGVCALFMLLGVLFFGIKLTRAGLNDRVRSELMSNITSFFVVAFLVGNIWMFYDLFFLINKVIVVTFREMAFTAANQGWDMVDSQSVLVDAILSLVFVGLGLWANFYYIMRKMMIIILMITGPLFITVSVFPNMRQISGTWAKELFSNIITQSIHAIMLWIFLIMSSADKTDWVMQIVFLSTFIPVSETIKSLLGASSTTGSFASGASLTALATAASAAKGIGQMSGVAPGRFSQSMDQLAGGNTNAQGSPSELGQPHSPRVEHKPNTLSRGMNSALSFGNMTSRIGGIAGIAAGGLIGLGLGPGGVAMGAAFGKNAGSTIGAVGGRAVSKGVVQPLVGATKGIASQYRNQQRNNETGFLNNTKAIMKGAVRGGLGFQDLSNEGIKNSGRNFVAGVAGVVGGERAYNTAYRLADKVPHGGNHSMQDLKTRVAAKDVRNLRYVQTNQGTYVAGFTKNHETGKYDRLERWSLNGDANPNLRDGQSIEMKATFNKNGRLQFNKDSLNLKGANNEVIGDRKQAISLHQEIQPEQLFSKRHQDVVKERRQRDTQFRMAREGALGRRK